MSPERITGDINIDDVEMNKRADIWSVGVIIYLLFAGKMPFIAETCQQLFDSIKRG